jgi:hypothetical protein
MSLIHHTITHIRKIVLERLLKQPPGVGGEETQIIPYPLSKRMGVSVHPVHHNELGRLPGRKNFHDRPLSD